HPAVFGVQRHLAVDGMGQQAVGTRPGGVVDGDAGLVAGGFDAEDFQALACSVGHPLSYAARPFERGGLPTRDHPMPSVKVRENEPFEFALRRFKRTCEKAGVLAETRKREFYEKPTQERKRKAAAAVKRQARRTSRDVTKRQ